MKKVKITKDIIFYLKNKNIKLAIPSNLTIKGFTNYYNQLNEIDGEYIELNDLIDYFRGVLKDTQPYYEYVSQIVCTDPIPESEFSAENLIKYYRNNGCKLLIDSKLKGTI